VSDTPRTDAFEALTERPINWWDFARELERENTALREKDEDWENAVLHARDHRCDEAHCTCVVPLIGKINQMERDNARLQMELDSSCNAEELRRVRAENAALRAALDQQANYQRELRADRDRLDWLLTYEGGRWLYWAVENGQWTPEEGASRAAIDAVREAQP
jgi:hypothetical protein